MSSPKRQSAVSPGYAKGFPGLMTYLDGVSENTLRSWFRRGMPHIRIGDVILFKLADVDAWLEKFRVGGTSEENEISIDDILAEVSK